ncbi:MAG: hypothetical protein HYY86_01310 [Candidatus Harrisonbacteria bacterium]|nr:hypothetical protein [Candidatus Harrisonbacteria bacterium]
MTKKIVVGSDQKPTSDQLLEMYEKLDAQTKEIRGQMKRGALNSRHVQALIEHRNPFVKKGAERCGFPTWKTIKLGTDLKTADDFRHALKVGGYRISDWANDILGKSAFTAANQETVELVKVSVKELTGKDQAPFQEIIQRAEERGLKKCPVEVGPQLRLQYSDQPYGEWLVVAMEPIAASDGYLRLFSVGHDVSGRWLSSYYGDPDFVWDGVYRFVFCK